METTSKFVYSLMAKYGRTEAVSEIFLSVWHCEVKKLSRDQLEKAYKHNYKYFPTLPEVMAVGRGYDDASLRHFLQSARNSYANKTFEKTCKDKYLYRAFLKNYGYLSGSSDEDKQIKRLQQELDYLLQYDCPEIPAALIDAPVGAVVSKEQAAANIARLKSILGGMFNKVGEAS